KLHARHHARDPLVGTGKRLAILIPYRREHPVARHIFISAADQIDVVLTSARCRQRRVATPDRPGDDFRATFAQLPRYFWKKSVVTYHHAQLAESRFKH